MAAALKRKGRVADPVRAQGWSVDTLEIAEIRNGMHEMDRVYAMNLKVIRKAARLAQQDLAARPGKRQAAVSNLERQNDLLLSTLASYTHAAGAEAQLVVTVAGKELRCDRYRHYGAITRTVPESSLVA